MGDSIQLLEQGAQATAADVRRDLERQVIDLFVNLADLLGLPRSVGELYGLLFASPEPLPMDELMARLNLSKGGTSQGLKILRSFGAVRTVYVDGDRRTHFSSETELRKLAAGFLKEQIQPHLVSGRERLERMQQLARGLPDG
ncbi:MAG: hypothetical protein NTV49_02215 [Kiritimatiellaeota bacterium]|nr:hypothetical protein [Kiritimatiellota bacterium]